jgi:hypothetical protein
MYLFKINLITQIFILNVKNAIGVRRYEKKYFSLVIILKLIKNAPTLLSGHLHFVLNYIVTGLS